MYAQYACMYRCSNHDTDFHINMLLYACMQTMYVQFCSGRLLSGPGLWTGLRTEATAVCQLLSVPRNCECLVGLCKNLGMLEPLNWGNSCVPVALCPQKLWKLGRIIRELRLLTCWSMQEKECMVVLMNWTCGQRRVGLLVSCLLLVPKSCNLIWQLHMSSTTPVQSRNREKGNKYFHTPERENNLFCTLFEQWSIIDDFPHTRITCGQCHCGSCKKLRQAWAEKMRSWDEKVVVVTK